MFDFGSFRRGVVNAEERIENRRAKNAQMYNDYVRNNPDASVDDREKFASTLAGGSEYYRSILPSRSTMEGNVQRRQDDLAYQAQQRRNAQINFDMNIMKQGADAITPFMVAGKNEEGLAVIKDLFGDQISDKMMPYIESVGSQAAKKLVEEEISNKLQLWELGGANAEDLNKLFEGFNPAYIGKGLTQSKAILKNKQDAAVKGYSEIVETAARSGNKVELDAAMDKAAKLYPHLTPADRTNEDARLMKLYEERRTEILRNAGVATENAKQTVITQVNEGKLANEADIRAAYEAAISTLGIDEEFLDQKKIDKDLDELVKKAGAMRISLLNDAEQKAEADARQKGEQRGLSIEKEDVDQLDAQLDLISNQGDTTDEGKAQAAKIKDQLYNSILEANSLYGINISDPVMAIRIAEQVEELRSEFPQGEVDPIFVKQAIDRIMLSPASGDLYGGSQEAIEKQAFLNTLQKFGVSSLEDIKDTAAFRQEFKDQRNGLYEEVFDLVDESIVNLNDVDAKVTAMNDGLEAKIDEIISSDLTNGLEEIYSSSPEDIINDPKIAAEYDNRVEVFKQIGDLQAEIESIKRLEIGYLQNAAKGGLKSMNNIEQVNKIKAKLDQITKMERVFEEKVKALVDQYNKVGDAIEAARSIALDNNANGKNNQAIIDFDAMAIQKAINENPNNQAAIIEAAAAALYADQTKPFSRKMSRTGQAPANVMSKDDIVAMIYSTLNIPLPETIEGKKVRQQRRSNR